MDIRKIILEKHNTGQIYIFPGARDYFDSKIRTEWWCEMSISELLRYYTLHLKNPPTDRCYHHCADPNEGIIYIDDPTDEEMEWLSLEIKLSTAINDFFGGKKDGMVKFVLMEISNG